MSTTAAAVPGTATAQSAAVPPRRGAAHRLRPPGGQIGRGDLVKADAAAADHGDVPTDLGLLGPQSDLAAANRLARLLGGGRIRCLYQPIVELGSGRRVGFEALARAPLESGYDSPDALFAAAARFGLVQQLDWACQHAAVADALRVGLRGPLLFVNVEPATLGAPPPSGLSRVLDAAGRSLRLVLELSERSVLARPTDILGLVRWARARGWGVAVDDVGVNPESIALMPFVEPDVIKLDLRVVQDRPSARTGRLLNAVLAQAERSGAVVLAEGIESDDHLERAVSLGARLGQGWMFGRPAPLPAALPEPAAGDLVAVGSHRPPALPASPFELARQWLTVRRGRTDLLVAISHDFENQASALADDAPVVLAAFQTADRFTPATARRYRQLSRTSALVGALGRGLSVEPAPGVRGGDLRADDPLLDEWTVTVLSPHFAGALIARDRGCGERIRRFDYAVTHDRSLVTAAAISLLSRLAPVTPPSDAAVADDHELKRDP